MWCDAVFDYFDDAIVLHSFDVLFEVGNEN